MAMFLGMMAGMLVTYITGYDPFYSFFQWFFCLMLVTLPFFGWHEYKANKEFKAELKRMREEWDRKYVTSNKDESYEQ